VRRTGESPLWSTSRQGETLDGDEIDPEQSFPNARFAE
jgi:hypothetical protein